jgi:two-component system osmolarity sensor histidine kinase EnvZ
MVRIGSQAGLPTLWVREAGDGSWIVMPLPSLRPPHSQGRKVVWLGIVFSLAVMAALLSAWRLQQPLTVLTQAVGRFRRGEQVPRLPERGPGELRALTHGFNQMVQEVARTESDRAAMLTGVAHDLRTPLARLRLRAELTDDVKLRDGVMRDVDAMAHIVDQFLVFAHGNADRSEPVEVDAQCVRITRSYRAVS